MKPLVLVLLFIVVTGLLLIAMLVNAPAQVAGDYRTNVTSVTWSTAASWQTYNGSTWVTASSKPGLTNNVYIQRGHTVTLTGNESCDDLHLNKDNSTTALALGTNTLSLYGKIRAYSGTVGTIPGTSSTAPGGNSDWITSTTGKISVVGNSRNLTEVGEWGVGIANVSSPNGFDLEINLTSDQTASFNTFFKCRSFNVVSGTLSMAVAARVAPAQTSRANSNFIIHSGATFISGATGSTENAVFGFDDDTSSDTLWVKSGGKLILTGATPKIGMLTIIFDGTVEYSRAGNQNLAERSHGGAHPNVYTNLILSGSGIKTIATSTHTVNGTFSIQGSATLDNNGATFTYGSSSILEYASSTANQSISIEEFAGSGSARVPPNLLINNTFGTVTLIASKTSFAGNITVSAGTLDLSTFTLNRSSAGGSLTISNGTTLKIGGTNTLPSNYSTHSIGTSSTIEYGGTAQAVASLNSSQYYGNLTISGSGIKTASTEIRTNGNLNLTAGTFASNSNQVIVYGNVTGTGIHTCTGTGELQLETDGATFSGATFGNFKIYSTGTITATGNATINGNLQLIAGTINDGGFTISVGSDITGTGSHTGSGKIRMTGSTRTISGVSLTNLELTNAGGYTLIASASINGVLTLTGGTLTVGANTLTLSGSSPVRTSGNINASNASSTVSFTNTGAITLPASTFTGNVKNLSVSGSGGSVALGQSLTITGAVTVGSGATLTLGANTLTGSGTTSITGAGTLSYTGALGTQVSSFTTNTFKTTGTYQLNGSSTQTLPADTYNNVYCTNTSAINLGGDVTIGGTLTLISGNGNFNIGANTLTISNPVAGSGASTLLVGGSTSNLTINGSAPSINIPGGVTSLNNLTVNNSQIITGESSLVINGTLTLGASAGFLDMGANTLTIGTSTSNLGTLSRSGGSIRGTLKRWFASGASSNNLFPLDNGSGSYSQAKITFNSLTTGGTLTATFHNSGSGSLPSQGNGNYLPTGPSMGNVNLINLAPQYWTITSGDGLASPNYNLELMGDAIPQVSNLSYIAIIKRVNSGNPWTWSSGNYSVSTGTNSNPVLYYNGGTSFSDFGVGGNVDNLLPVEYSSFTSSLNGRNVILNWSTVSELNNSGFEIERKSSGNDWKKISFVEGNGTTNNPQNYTFTDINLNTGNYIYRLKQIDYNGNFGYHDLSHEVVIGIPAKYSLAQNYPNPFNPVTQINYELPITNYVSLKVYDIQGREVAQLVNEVKDAGYYSVQFDAKNLSSGMYFYKLTTDKFSDVKKMVIVK